MLQFTHRPFPDHGPSPIQACTNVYSRRDRCCTGPLTHATHRTAIPYAVQGVTVYCGISERRSVHECECVIPGTIPGWDVHCRADGTAFEFVVVHRKRGGWSEARATAWGIATGRMYVSIDHIWFELCLIRYLLLGSSIINSYSGHWY